jgi:hypothetical protein
LGKSARERVNEKGEAKRREREKNADILETWLCPGSKVVEHSTHPKIVGSNRRHDTQHSDIQFNDIQHNDIQHNDIQFNDIQFNDIQFNDIQHNDIQHKEP